METFTTGQVYTVTPEDGGNTTDWTFPSPENIPLLAQKHSFFKYALIVNNYYGLFIVMCGLIGNTLSFLVMVQVSRFFHSSSIAALLKMISKDYYFTEAFWLLSTLELSLIDSTLRVQSGAY